MCRADPEEHERRQHDETDPVEEPVVTTPYDNLLQGFDDEEHDAEPENQIGDAAFGQFPCEEDLQRIEIEDGGIDKECGGKDPVQQQVDDL